MHVLGNILDKLKQRGFRLTPIRRAVLDLLIKSVTPISSPDIQKFLSKNKISANKTTIYRELAFLKEEGIIKELHLGDNAKNYEIITDGHHHHLICTKCDEIEDVEMDKELKREESKIRKSRKFKIINHSLEFYGLCKNCQ